MNPQLRCVLFTFGLLLAGAGSALAATHYVDVNSTNATPPYTSWATAATNIQDAVDAAVVGDEVVVTNGLYSPVFVDRPLILRSVNGPTVTTIDGGASVRCVYLTANASFSGFTLTNGFTYGSAPGAGVYCESPSAVVSNCVIIGNAATPLNGAYTNAIGGGAYGGTLNNCTLIGNRAGRGGGEVDALGGGAAYCTLNNCTLSGNSAIGSVDGDSLTHAFGGGAYYCILNGCTLSGNWAQVFYPVIHSQAYGGGAYASTLNNCTLTGNSVHAPLGGSAFAAGGGAYDCTLNNCILYFNRGMLGYIDTYNYYSGFLNFCCTTPLPTYGAGNIANAPLFVDTNGWANLRLQSNSPCINAGNNASAPAGPDLDGNPRIVGGTVDIGAYEFQSLSLLNFSVASNQAGFSITGQSNQVVIVETSTDLTNWSPLATNTLSGHPSSFSDPAPASLPRRFYRAQSQ